MRDYLDADEPMPGTDVPGGAMPPAERARASTVPHDDIRPEPVRGLPQALPEGERILWQGRPASLALARDALNAQWVMGWFALLAAWRGGAALVDAPAVEAARVAGLYLGTGALACTILVACATVMARATLYTITTRRVSMRIGAALTLHAQVPFSRLGSVDLALSRDGSGTIALTPIGRSPLSYLVLWPHCRSWHAREPKPALRSIPQAQAVADLLAEAATGGLVVAVRGDRAAPVASRGGSAHPIPAE